MGSYLGYTLSGICTAEGLDCPVCGKEKVRLAWPAVLHTEAYKWWRCWHVTVIFMVPLTPSSPDLAQKQLKSGVSLSSSLKLYGSLQIPS